MTRRKPQTKELHPLRLTLPTLDGIQAVSRIPLKVTRHQRRVKVRLLLNMQTARQRMLER
jgi:hypothetical protein